MESLVQFALFHSLFSVLMASSTIPISPFTVHNTGYHTVHSHGSQSSSIQRRDKSRLVYSYLYHSPWFGSSLPPTPSTHQFNTESIAVHPRLYQRPEYSLWPSPQCNPLATFCLFSFRHMTLLKRSCSLFLVLFIFCNFFFLTTKH